MSIVSFISSKCREFGNHVFICNYNGELITYSEFLSHVRSVSCEMEHIGVFNGMRFSIALPNSPEFLYLLFGGVSLGGIAVNLNPQMSVDEFDFRLTDAGVNFLFTTSEVYFRIREVLIAKKIKCFIVKDLSADFIEDQEELYFAEALNISLILSKNKSHELNNRDSDIAFLQYTGGTTGKTKATMITHQNVLSSVKQMSQYLSPRLNTREERFVVTFPFYHVFSIVFQVLMAMHYGSTIILYPYVRDFVVLKSILRQENFTVFVGVHTLYKMMLHDSEINKLKFPSTKLFIAGAEHVQPITKMRWQQATGHLIIEGYGLTETSALASMSALNSEENDIDGIGLPLPGTEFKLIDENEYTVTEANMPGEICIHGPQVVSGYWNRPEDNVATFVDGWLKTGDIAIRKLNGQYKIIDRKKDMINVSGFNVYPNEVEAVLMQYPGISDCAAVAIPDEKSGERVAVFVVSDKMVDSSLLIAFCREKLSGYKVPVYVEQLAALPKSPVGKTLRVNLRGKFIKT